MSPLLFSVLFSVLLADLEEEIGKVKWRGIKVSEERVYTLAYADDLVLLAEREEEYNGKIGGVFEKRSWN